MDILGFFSKLFSTTNLYKTLLIQQDQSPKIWFKYFKFQTAWWALERKIIQQWLDSELLPQVNYMYNKFCLQSTMQAYVPDEDYFRAGKCKLLRFRFSYHLFSFCFKRRGWKNGVTFSSLFQTIQQTANVLKLHYIVEFSISLFIRKESVPWNILVLA